MRIFVLKATYELRVSRKSHLRDHPNERTPYHIHTGDSFLSQGFRTQKTIYLDFAHKADKPCF